MVAASVTVETAPDSGTRLRREVELYADPDAPAVAQAMLREVVEVYPDGSATVKAWVAVTFSLSQGLHATGAGAARPVTAQELCEVVRIAYDPAVARLIDSARGRGRGAGAEVE